MFYNGMAYENVPTTKEINFNNLNIFNMKRLINILQSIKAFFIRCVSNSTQNAIRPTDINNSFFNEKKYNIDIITAQLHLSTWDYQNNMDRLIKKELMSEIAKRIKVEIISINKSDAHGWERDAHTVTAQCKIIFID